MHDPTPQPAVCSLSGCTKPVKRRGLCYGHYMKWWRYGDPTWTQPKRRRNLLGQRFGQVTVIEELDEGHWLCLCDCGNKSRVRGWSLTSGGTTTCNDGPTHRRADDISYSAAHARMKRDRGPASTHSCVDCGETAGHWSYDHADPDEVRTPEGYAYSLKTNHYQPRCVPCHKTFDMGRADARAEEIVRSEGAKFDGA